uniref:Uncharacterized protein n=1 Tax=Knipowitschia caucasica TaxID=637954 RepID=A0AAV2IXP5_KNICA
MIRGVPLSECPLTSCVQYTNHHTHSNRDRTHHGRTAPNTLTVRDRTEDLTLICHRAPGGETSADHNEDDEDGSETSTSPHSHAPSSPTALKVRLSSSINLTLLLSRTPPYCPRPRSFSASVFSLRHRPPPPPGPGRRGPPRDFPLQSEGGGGGGGGGEDGGALDPIRLHPRPSAPRHRSPLPQRPQLILLPLERSPHSSSHHAHITPQTHPSLLPIWGGGGGAPQLYPPARASPLPPPVLPLCAQSRPTNLLTLLIYTRSTIPIAPPPSHWIFSPISGQLRSGHHLSSAQSSPIPSLHPLAARLSSLSHLSPLTLRSLSLPTILSLYANPILLRSSPLPPSALRTSLQAITPGNPPNPRWSSSELPPQIEEDRTVLRIKKRNLLLRPADSSPSVRRSKLSHQEHPSQPSHTLRHLFRRTLIARGYLISTPHPNHGSPLSLRYLFACRPRVPALSLISLSPRTALSCSSPPDISTPPPIAPSVPIPIHVTHTRPRSHRLRSAISHGPRLIKTKRIYIPLRPLALRRSPRSRRAIDHRTRTLAAAPRVRPLISPHLTVMISVALTLPSHTTPSALLPRTLLIVSTATLLYPTVDPLALGPRISPTTPCSSSSSQLNASHSPRISFFPANFSSSPSFYPSPHSRSPSRNIPFLLSSQSPTHSRALPRSRGRRVRCIVAHPLSSPRISHIFTTLLSSSLRQIIICSFLLPPPNSSLEAHLSPPHTLYTSPPLSNVSLLDGLCAISCSLSPTHLAASRSPLSTTTLPPLLSSSPLLSPQASAIRSSGSPLSSSLSTTPPNSSPRLHSSSPSPRSLSPSPLRGISHPVSPLNVGPLLRGSSVSRIITPALSTLSFITPHLPLSPSPSGHPLSASLLLLPPVHKASRTLSSLALSLSSSLGSLSPPASTSRSPSIPDTFLPSAPSSCLSSSATLAHHSRMFSLSLTQAWSSSKVQTQAWSSSKVQTQAWSSSEVQTQAWSSSKVQTRALSTCEVQTQTQAWSTCEVQTQTQALSTCEVQTQTQAWSTCEVQTQKVDLPHSENWYEEYEIAVRCMQVREAKFNAELELAREKLAKKEKEHQEVCEKLMQLQSLNLSLEKDLEQANDNSRKHESERQEACEKLKVLQLSHEKELQENFEELRVLKQSLEERDSVGKSSEKQISENENQSQKIEMLERQLQEFEELREELSLSVRQNQNLEKELQLLQMKVETQCEAQGSVGTKTQSSAQKKMEMLERQLKEFEDVKKEYIWCVEQNMSLEKDLEQAKETSRKHEAEHKEACEKLMELKVSQTKAFDDHLEELSVFKEGFKKQVEARRRLEQQVSEVAPQEKPSVCETQTQTVASAEMLTDPKAVKVETSTSDVPTQNLDQATRALFEKPQTSAEESRPQSHKDDCTELKGNVKNLTEIFENKLEQDTQKQGPELQRNRVKGKSVSALMKKFEF